MSEASADYVCPDCGEQFASGAALGGHRSVHRRDNPSSHAAGRRANPSRRAAGQVNASVRERLEASLGEAAAPFREELRHITDDIAATERKLHELHDTRRFIERTVRRLAPQEPRASRAAQTAGTAKHHATLDDEKRAALVTYFEQRRAELADGFTGEDIVRGLQAANIKPVMSPQKARQLLRQLHDEGIVRADKVTRGGGMTYKIVGGDEHVRGDHGPA